MSIKSWIAKKFNNLGQEIPDPTPIAIPAGFGVPEPIESRIRRLVRAQVSQEAMRAGMETFEEADDFDVGDDLDPTSPWEMNFDQMQRSTKSGFQEEAPKEKAAPKKEASSPEPKKPKPQSEPKAKRRRVFEEVDESDEDES